MPTPTFRLADHLLGGNLDDRLRTWREEKRSYEWIAREVRQLTDGQVDVSFATVRNWVTFTPEPETAS